MRLVWCWCSSEMVIVFSLSVYVEMVPDSRYSAASVDIAWERSSKAAWQGFEPACLPA